MLQLLRPTPSLPGRPLLLRAFISISRSSASTSFVWKCSPAAPDRKRSAAPREVTETGPSSWRSLYNASLVVGQRWPGDVSGFPR